MVISNTTFCILFQFSAQSIDKEIDMATNENSTSATTTELNKNDESVDSSAKNQTKVTVEKDLEGQERRIRISFLENQQAELETEIRLLKQGGKTNIVYLFQRACLFFHSKK